MVKVDDLIYNRQHKIVNCVFMTFMYVLDIIFIAASQRLEEISTTQHRNAIKPTVVISRPPVARHLFIRK